MANTQHGQVIQKINAQTITVAVITYKNHPLYKKRYIYSKKYLVHDPQERAQLEDRVIIRQSRPFSRRKCWLLEKVVTQGGHTAAVKRDLQALEPPSPAAEKPVNKGVTPKTSPKVASKAKPVSSKSKDDKPKEPKP